MNFDFIKNLFTYIPTNSNDENTFSISNTSNNYDDSIIINNEKEKNVSASLDDNLEYLKYKYNLLINKDIKYRPFNILIQNKKIPAFIFYIDGLVNNDLINNYVLKPLFIKDDENLKSSFITIHSRREHNKNIRKFNLESYLLNTLIPENSATKESNFSTIIEMINTGFAAIFVESLNTAIMVEVKQNIGRSVDEPKTEYISNGSHEGFVENLRTNTSLIRKIINNENLVIEETSIGNISKTKISICYMQNITNESLINEVKRRLNNINIDYLLSSGQLEQLIKDDYNSPFPEAIFTERPDRASSYLLLGRIILLVQGSPFAIVLPATLIDFLVSAEDYNLNYYYSNFIKIIRTLALISALLIPGLYIAITMYHYELIPSELLFAIISAREAIPFPIIFEIIIMEMCFELIQEASIRVSSSFSTTVGIIGALILGDAAVAANIVSPILIIIVALSGICSFTIPDNELRYSLKIFRFMYIILGYLAGFLGIAFGLFIQLLLLSKQQSFGIEFLSPYIGNTTKSNGILINPIWHKETRNQNLNTKKPKIENNISMEWRKNGK